MNKNYSIIGHVLDITVYGLLLILLTLLQTSFVTRFPIFNGIPDLMIGAICCIGIYRGENSAALFGLLAGLCCDALGSVGVSLLPLFYTVVGYVCGRVGSGAKDGARFVAFSICLIPLCFARITVSFINHLIVYFDSLDVLQLLLYTLLPEFLYTLVVCFPVFLLVKLFDIPLNIARKRGGLY